MANSLPRLLAISPPQLDLPALVAWVAPLLENGCQWIQFRPKGIPPEEALLQANTLRDITRHRCLLSINDDPLLALAVKADGVHLGQDDPDPQAARDLLGADALIGLSTHTESEITKGKENPVDYLGWGPCFASPTKTLSYPVLGKNQRKKAVQIAYPLPLVAIGGVTSDRAKTLWREGFSSVAIISALADPAQSPSTLKALFSTS